MKIGVYAHTNAPEQEPKGPRYTRKSNDLQGGLEKGFDLLFYVSPFFPFLFTTILSFLL